MATKDRRVAIPVNAMELMALGLAEVAIQEAAATLHVGGYQRPSDEVFRQIAHAATQAALAMPYLVADMAATTDVQLEDAARALGASVVAELLGPPPAAH